MRCRAIAVHQCGSTALRAHLPYSCCRLHQLSTETNEAVTAAEAAFRELFALNSSSIAVIRLYAAFNLHVLANTEKATVLTTEADRLEDVKSKDHSAEGAGRLNILAESKLDIFSDSTAVVQLSASPRDVGSIVSLNAFGVQAVRLLASAIGAPVGLQPDAPTHRRHARACTQTLPDNR